MTAFRRGSWQRLVALGAPVSLACGLLPADLALIVITLLAAVCMTALLRGARRNGAADLAPFRMLTFGGYAFVGGNLTRAVHSEITDVPNPFPSPADIFWYVGFALLAAAFLQLVRRRSAQIEGDNILDAVLFAVVIGTLALIFVVVPFLQLRLGGILGQSMTVLYTVFDVLLLSVTVRLAVGSGRRSTSYYLLLGCATCVAVSDLFTSITIMQSGVVTGVPQMIVSWTTAFAFVLGGAAGRHPSIARLADRPAIRDIQLSSRRLALLLLAVLTVVAVLVFSVLDGNRARIAVSGAGTLLVVLLVLGRLALLVHSNERKAAREAILRAAAGALARSTSTAEMRRVACEELVKLTGGGSAWIVGRDDELDMASAIGDRPDAVRQRLFERGARTELGPADESALDEDLADPDARSVVVAPVRVRRAEGLLLVGATDAPVSQQTLYAVETLATQVAGAIDGLLLAEEIHRREQEQRFRALVEHSSDLVIVLDEDGLVSFASPACMPLLGLTEQQMVGRHPFERVHPEDRFGAASLLDRSWAIDGVLDPIEVRFKHVSNGWRWFELLVENLLEQPEVGAVIIHTRDVTDRRRAQEELATREARFRSLVQHNADLIAIIDDDLQLTYVSPAARSMLGYEPDALVGRPITDIIPAEQLLLGNEMLPAMAEAEARDADGRRRTVELTITDLRSDPAVAGIVVNARDVSERKTLEGQLRHLAMHDPLTGLANRNLLHDRLGKALEDPRCGVALLYIDIDDFKALNDSLGHGYGDVALTEVARRLVAMLRDSDLAARIGGDEFAVLIEGSAAGDPMALAARILESVRAPIRLGHHEVQLTVSLGAALRDGDSTVTTLTRNADIAMYLAKSDGKDRRQLFRPEMLEAFNERIELKRDLRQVIDRQELHLVYQPVYELQSGRMTSVEALVRWQHPTRGLVPPLQFIPLAEESGEILEIGSWVLDQACAQLAAWRASGGADDLSMAVNLSVVQLENERLLAEVEHSLLVHGLEPSALILEVTESVLAANVDLVRLQLTALRALGVRLALDDFGTGYSSLVYLQHFKLDILKIDKSFLGGGKDRLQQEGLVRAIIDLARNHGMSTTAEGVEETEQLAMLGRLGCSSVQGYLFAKPLPAGDVLGAGGRAARYVDQVVNPAQRVN